MQKGKAELDLSFLEGGRMVICTPFLPLFLRNGLASLRSVMDFREGQIFKEQKFRSVCHFSLSDGEKKKAFFLKRHRNPPWRDQIRDFLRNGRGLSGGRREWENTWKIRELGIQTIDPVGFGERRRWGWEVESFLISEELDGACRLTEFLPRCFTPPLDPSLLSRKRDLVRSLALLARRMHEGGLFHRDFYLGHLFVKTKEGGQIELYLMDLQRVIMSRWREERWRIKDLASLDFSAPAGWFTATDRLRFYKQYRGIRRLSRIDRPLIGRILKKSHRIASHTRKLLERGEILNAPWGFEKHAA